MLTGIAASIKVDMNAPTVASAYLVGFLVSPALDNW